MTSRIFSFLLALATLLLCSCDPKYWYADATEWIIGLPIDNMCMIAEPLCIVDSAQISDMRQAAILSEARQSEQAPSFKVIPKGSRFLVKAPAAGDTPDDSLRPALPAGTHVELLRVIIERMENAAHRDLYAVYAELALPQDRKTVWVFLSCSSDPKELPLLLTPSSGMPLSLDMSDALEYAEKREIRR